MDAALIVGGTEIHAEQRVAWNLPADQLCGSELQSILLSGKQIRVTRLVMSSGHACKDIGLDEKDFWTFAHEKVEAPASTGNCLGSRIDDLLPLRVQNSRSMRQ